MDLRLAKGESASADEIMVSKKVGGTRRQRKGTTPLPNWYGLPSGKKRNKITAGLKTTISKKSWS